jgi:hypothetical protein
MPPVRLPPDRLAAFLSAAVVVVAGAAAAVAPLLPEGLVLRGYACGGGGDEQRCIDIARRLSLVEISPRAWLFVAGGVLCAVLGAATLVVVWRTSRTVLPLAFVLTAVALAGLAQMERISAFVDPAGTEGTVGRTLEDWDPFLEPELRDMREDALRRYAGTRTEPGGPLYDREQILDSFAVREQVGWRAFQAAVVVLFFAALLGLASAVTSRPALAVTITGTVGIFVWAYVIDRVTPCDGGECWDGVLPVAAFVLAVIWWAVYFLASAAARRQEARRG